MVELIKLINNKLKTAAIKSANDAGKSSNTIQLSPKYLFLHYLQNILSVVWHKTTIYMVYTVCKNYRVKVVETDPSGKMMRPFVSCRPEMIGKY